MRRVILGMLVVAVLLDVTYWSLWFGHRDWIASKHTQAYYDFENAFPLADAWLGLTCVLALVTLRAHRPSALFGCSPPGAPARTWAAWICSTTSSTASSPVAAGVRSRP